MTVLLLTLLLAQESQTVFRTEKAVYYPMVKKCKEGEAQITANPRAAIELFTEITANPKVKKIECRIRIEERPAEYTPWYNFFPYQYRGRARIARAAKSEPEAALVLLEGAVVDLKASTQRGVAASAPFLKKAQTELARVKAVVAAASAPTPAAPKPKDLVAEFRRGWQTLVDARRYADARTYIEKSGGSLKPAERQVFVRDTEDACRRYVARFLDDYASNLGRTTLDSLSTLSLRRFDADFALPDPKQVCVKLASLEWAASFRPVLDKLRKEEEALDDVFAHAAQAAALEAADGKPWFRPAAELGHSLVERRIRARVEESRTAPAARRDVLKSEAIALKQRWVKLTAGLEADFRKRQTYITVRDKALDALLGGFPIDVEAVGKAGPALDATFAADDPDAALEKIESDLAAIHRNQGSRMTVESKRELLTYLMVSVSLRLLLSGETADQVAARQELVRWVPGLKAVGGPLDVSRFGPKVSKVLSRLGL